MTGRSQGDFVVVWQDQYSADRSEIRGQLFKRGNLGDRVWLDEDENGLQDAGEPGVEGVQLSVYDSFDNLINTTTSDSDGLWNFYAPPGDLTLEVELPAPFQFTAQRQGVDSTLDSDFDPSTGRVEISTVFDQVDFDLDAGLVPPLFADGFESGNTVNWSSTQP